MSLEDIKARIADCQSYNFGMRNADKLAHEDAPKLLAALEAVIDIANNYRLVEDQMVFDAIDEALGG